MAKYYGSQLKRIVFSYSFIKVKVMINYGFIRCFHESRIPSLQICYRYLLWFLFQLANWEKNCENKYTIENMWWIHYKIIWQPQISTGCSLSDQHILSPINPNMMTDLFRFTWIVLKFKTTNFEHFFVNLTTISCQYYGLIGDKIWWSDKERPVLTYFHIIL